MNSSSAPLEVSFRIRRSRPGIASHFDLFRIAINPDGKVLDGLDAIWATQDHGVMFRRACHHSSCGACAMRINGQERLACITPVAVALQEHDPVVVEPLNNLPIVADLVVDVAGFFARMTASDMVITRRGEDVLPVSVDPLPPKVESVAVHPLEGAASVSRFESCIECGICVSACPSMAADDGFLGPAALAAIHRTRQATGDGEEARRLLALADGEGGVWRCHSSFECSATCPQGVDPAAQIMDLRRQILSLRLKSLGRR